MSARCSASAFSSSFTNRPLPPILASETAEHPVALGGHAQDLDLQARIEREQPVADVVSLPQRESALAGGDGEPGGEHAAGSEGERGSQPRIARGSYTCTPAPDVAAPSCALSRLRVRDRSRPARAVVRPAAPPASARAANAQRSRRRTSRSPPSTACRSSRRCSSRRCSRRSRRAGRTRRSCARRSPRSSSRASCSSRRPRSKAWTRTPRCCAIAEEAKRSAMIQRYHAARSSSPTRSPTSRSRPTTRR